MKKKLLAIVLAATTAVMGSFSLVACSGNDGKDGTTPHIGENGNWFIGETDTGVNASGEQGLSAYEIYKKYHPEYSGSEEQWIDDLVNNRLIETIPNEPDEPDEPNYPEAEITISFNNVEYVLEYQLYRDMYPQTVQHFIELADNGFYNNTFVHHYSTSNWYAGGYDYISNTTDGKNAYTAAYNGGVEGFREYLEKASKEKAYAELANPAAGKITPSVYKDLIDGDLSQPLTTLIGEFSNNNHIVENGALKSSYGCLRMYYTPKAMIDSVKDVRVYLDRQGSPKGVTGDYKYNSATSIFSMQVNSTVSKDSSYCIFGLLQDKTPLDSLKKAVSTYSSSIGSTKFSLDLNLYADNYDEYVGANVNEVIYRATSVPIIIKSVNITKY